MKSYLVNIILIIVLLSYLNSYAQTESNFNLLSKLVEESTIKISQLLKDENPDVFLEFSSPPNYDIFKNIIIGTFGKEAVAITTDNQAADIIINYTLNDAAVGYNETFRDGLFGVYLVERQADLNCSFNLVRNSRVFKSDNINISRIDTIKYDEIRSLENQSLHYTTGEIPPEPFFSSILEPVIAVGTAIVTVILFFTVRSK